MASTATNADNKGGAGAGSRKRKLNQKDNTDSDVEAPPSKSQPSSDSPDPVTSTNAANSTAGSGDEAAAAGGGESSSSPSQQNGGEQSNENKELLERITEVEDQKRQIEEGTHPEWKRKSDALQRVRDRRVFAAERFKQMQIENIQGLYEYEVLEAECSYKSAMDDLKAKLLDTMEQRVKKLEEDRERVLKQLERVGQTRVLRSKNVFRTDEQPEISMNGVASRISDDVAYGSVSMFLSDAEIKDDLKKISSDLAERAKAYYDAQSDSMVEVTVEDNCLHYGEHCLLKGESIIFTSMLSGEDFFGRIASIRPNEVLVKLSDGTKARIHMTYLRNGRIRLKVEDDLYDD